MSKSVLVIGGAGYIGSHVTLELCELGYDVTVFDNLSTGNYKNVDSRANFVQGDILNPSDLRNLFSRTFDTVMHLAALKSSGESMENPEDYAKTNITGTINILNQMVIHDIKHIIFSSSAAVYGNPEYLPIDEDHPTIPVNFYGFTKLEIEKILAWYSKLKQIRFAVLRYFNAAGYDSFEKIKGVEKNSCNLLPIVMETASGIREEMEVYGDNYDTPDGSCIRDYIHVSDLVSAHVKALDYLTEKNQNITVNLATGSGYSVFDVISEAREITRMQIPYKVVGRREGDSPELIAKSKYANNLLGWEPKYSNLHTILNSMWSLYSLKIQVQK